MKDARISQFNAAGALSGDEYVPVAQLRDTDNVVRTVYTNPNAFKQFVLDSVSDVFCPTGSIGTYASSVTTADVPGGWLLCNGQSVSRTTYSKLFDRIGTIYGATSDTTFNIPNLKGRVVMGYCSYASTISLSGASNSTISLGNVGGEYVHRLVASEMPIKISPLQSLPSNPIIKTLYSSGTFYGGSGPISMNAQVTGGLKALFNGTLPPTIKFAYGFGQSCGLVTNAGSWKSLGCSGNNAYTSGTVTVAPDSKGDVFFQITDQGWGGHGLNVSIYLPGATTLVAREAGPTTTTTPFNVTQPYMVMNYIIKY
jgi:microcystin-dependent protein